MKILLVLFTALLLVSGSALTAPSEFPLIKGEYFGRPRPGPKAEPFATAVLSGHEGHYIRAVTFAPGGEEAYWPVIDLNDNYQRWIVSSRLVEGKWSTPKLASFSSKGLFDDVPYITSDGSRLVFMSGRPVEEGGKVEKERIWYMDRAGKGWSEPVPLPPSINEAFTIHQQVSLDREGNLYFGGEGEGGHGSLDICLSRSVDGSYEDPVNLGPVINSAEGDYAPSISPDGSFLIFTRSIGESGTLMISFRKKAGDWSRPVDLRGSIEGLEGKNLSNSCLTPDSKQMIFFVETGDEVAPHWIDTSFIEKLRKETYLP